MAVIESVPLCTEIAPAETLGAALPPFDEQSSTTQAPKVWTVQPPPAPPAPELWVKNPKSDVYSASTSTSTSPKPTIAPPLPPPAPAPPPPAPVLLLDPVAMPFTLSTVELHAQRAAADAR